MAVMVAVSRTLSVKIFRQKHQVSFMPGESVKSIIEVLATLPEWSVVDDVDTSDSGITTIVFHEEKRVE
jgi:hypothetical protein